MKWKLKEKQLKTCERNMQELTYSIKRQNLRIMGIEEGHIIIKTTSTANRERILKAVREKKQITYKGKPIKITADFLTETLKSRRAWSEVFWALNENNFNPRILYPAKLSFKIDGAINVFHDKQKLKQYMTTKPPLQNILQGILHTENESKQSHERTGSTKPQEKIRKGVREQH
jgi:Holliday junction resolvase RusA-like endonuclease